MRVSGTAATGTAIIAVDDLGENQIIVSPGANSGLTAADVEAGLAAVQAGDVVVLQLEIPTALVRQAARTARSRGAFVILNAAPAPGQIDGLLDDVDLLVVNEQEIQALAGLAGVPGNHRDLVQTLPPALGPAIVCTAGAEGSFTVLDGGLVHVPAAKVAAQDTTGAGDTFVGYLAASLAEPPRRPACRNDPRHPRFGPRSHAQRRHGIDSMAARELPAPAPASDIPSPVVQY